MELRVFALLGALLLPLAAFAQSPTPRLVAAGVTEAPDVSPDVSMDCVVTPSAGGSALCGAPLSATDEVGGPGLDKFPIDRFDGSKYLRSH